MEPSKAARRHRHKRISISWKLFAYLTLFTTFVLIVVWVFQIGLLNYFYRQSRYEELDSAETSLEWTLQNRPQELGQQVNKLAAKYDTCIQVFRLRWTPGRGYADTIASSPDMSSDCIIHNMEEGYLTYLYKQADENGGEYTILVSPDDQNDMVLHGTMTSRPPLPGSSGWRKLLESETVLRAAIETVESEDGETTETEVYLILLNAELVPLNATVQTLKTQFWVISVILLCGAILLAILISRNISTPIKKMNTAAKRLAKGDYDADFRVGGYREVMELSDSLTQAAEALSQSDTLQKELIANISHDLRTPLTMIVGYGEVMRDIPDENTPENVQVIIDETKRLADLVNDLLDLSKLQAGTRKPKLEVFSLSDTVQAVMARYGKLTERDGYRIELDMDQDVEVRADRTMLLQVIYNLINNAINYTGEDKLVRVTQRTLRDSGKVRISVTDSGEGIPPEQIPLIWDRYYKVDKVHRRAMIGTGLGLSIVKQILEAHAATYGVESKLGRGSTFWFEMTIVKKEEADADIEAEQVEM